MAFIARRDGAKGLQDLQDFSDLTNHREFSVTTFISLAQRSGAEKALPSQLSEIDFTAAEREVVQSSSLFRFGTLVPIRREIYGPNTDSQSNGKRMGKGANQVGSIGVQTDEARTNEAKRLISSIETISRSKWGAEYSRFFREVHETQFAGNLFRRNWDIQISYDFGELSSGVVRETINWEYELVNLSEHEIETEITLTHAKSSGAGQIQRIYSMDDQGRRQEIELLEDGSHEGHHWKRDISKVKLLPDQRYFVTLYYVNIWPVNPGKVKIHNALTSKHPCLGCHMRFQLPTGFRVSLLKRRIIEPNVVNSVFDVRFAEPLLAEQKIEYVLERVNDDEK